MGVVVATNHVVNHTPIISTLAVHIQPHVCTDGSSSSSYEESNSFDMTIYRVLNMQSDLTTMTRPTVLKNEWDLFIDTACRKTDGLEYNIAFNNLNDYLGSIGVSNGIC